MNRLPEVTPLSVAVLQMEVVDGEPDRNLAQALELAAAAASDGARLLLLPELWTTGYAHDRWAAVADADSAGILAELGSFCVEHGVYVGGSTIEREEGGGLVNRFRLVGPDGSVRATYDKAHLFGAMREDRYLVAGRSRQRMDVDGWPAAASICFDLRFPEMYRLDAVDGAVLFLVPSEWPAERWEIMRGLAWARAVENQAFLVLCNRSGAGDDGTVFAGRSMVVAPDGAVLAEAGVEATTLRCVLEPAALGLRDRLPVLDRRVASVDTADAPSL